MKIIAIRGKNLASLESEFALDFSAEPLRSAGIFAITGSTGSGKSTLLDALCLALFDNTPRLSQAGDKQIAILDVKNESIGQKDCRTILRRGTAEGYAEVDFVSLGGETFRARWAVSRARGKIDGRLKDSEIRVLNLSTNVEVQGLKRELLAKLSELVGLTFEQFTRAVLLAQGDFATFLKADKNEKATLLEKLTGTDIYSRISASIYEKTKLAEQQYESLQARLNDIALLDQEQIAALEAERNQLLPSVAALREEVNVLTAKLKWIEANELLQRSTVDAEAQLLRMEQTIAEAAPLLEVTLAEEQQQLDAAAAQKEAEIVRARELEVQTLGIADNTHQAEQELKAALEAKLRIEKSIATAQQQATTATENGKKLAEWLNNYKAKNYAKIVEHTDLIVARLNEAQSIAEQVATNAKLAAENQTLLAAGAARLATLTAEAERLNRLLPAEIATLRAKLQAGTPCPVCGSIHHPLQGTGGEQSLQEAELNKAKQSVAAEAEQLTRSVEARKTEITRLCTLVEDYQKQSAAALAKAQQHLEVMPEWHKLFEQGVLQNNLQKFAAQWKEKELQLAEIQNTMAAKASTIEGEQRHLAESLAHLALQQRKHAELSAALGLLQKERATLLGGKAVKEVEADFARRKKLLADRLQEATQRLSLLREQRASAKATLEERRLNLLKHNEDKAKPLPQETKPTLTTALAQAAAQVEQQSKRAITIEVTLCKQAEERQRSAALQKELTDKGAAAENWRKLNALLGSADGTKFKAIAQGYTLDALLTYANRHLQELSKRYLLQRIPETLALQVVDLDMLGELRTVHSLSGGESFLVSLALALGLSALSSNRMKVESLFIDEGFGSLDADTLRVAMDALERLQTQGRKIGVISHIAEMTERITTQVCVVKTSNGKSKVETRSTEGKPS